MRIVVLGINYAPELTGIGPYNTMLCDFLAEDGHEVEMVTGFSYYPEWKKKQQDSSTVYRQEMNGRVRVHRCWLYVPKRVRALQRIAHEASFVFSALIRVLTLRRPDLYIVVSPPLLLGVAAAIASVLKRARFVFHVQDLQPDAALSLGMLKDRPLLARLLYGLEAIAYSWATRVSAISPGMLRRLVNKGVSAGKLVYFPNAVSLPATIPSRNSFRSRNQIGVDTFIVLYSGNLGVKQGLGALLDAAVLLQKRTDCSAGRTNREIRFVIAGAGAHRETIVSYIASHELKNITLLPLQAPDAYHEMLIDADCCAITQQPGTGSLFFPSKLLTTLAFGRPVLCIADEQSDLAMAVREGKFGAIVAPGEVPLIADQIEAWATSKDLGVMGEAGRSYVRRFETAKVLGNFEAELIRLHSEGPLTRFKEPGEVMSNSAHSKSTLRSGKSEEAAAGSTPQVRN